MCAILSASLQYIVTVFSSSYPSQERSHLSDSRVLFLEALEVILSQDEISFLPTRKEFILLLPQQPFLYWSWNVLLEQKNSYQSYFNAENMRVQSTVNTESVKICEHLKPND